MHSKIVRQSDHEWPPTQLRLLERATQDHNVCIRGSAQHAAARALARQGIGRIDKGNAWKRTRFHLTERGYEAARQLGFVRNSDPYAEGADAALAGQSSTSNPYPVATDAHLSWNDGYVSIREE